MNNSNLPQSPRRRAGRPTGMKSSQKSDVVSRVRSALNMTQESFARELGCSLSNVQKMESEQRTPGTRALKINLAQLAKRAGVEVEASPDEKILEK